MTGGSSLGLASNVFMDEASGHAWSDLLQNEFLEGFFVALRQTMGSAFAEFRFYIFSPFAADTVPASARYVGSNKILLFLSDETMSVPWHLRACYAAIFKTHLPYEIGDGRIFPFNLGIMRVSSEDL